MRKSLVVFIALLALLGGMRLALPNIIRRAANKKLAEIPGYNGIVGDVRLALWRGLFAFDDFNLEHKNGDMAVSIKRMEMSILWPYLFHKEFIGKLAVTDPRLVLVVSKPAKASKKAKEKGEEIEKTVEKETGKSIPQAIADVIPFRIDRFELINGVIVLKETEQHADKNEKSPEQAPFLTDLHILVTNLTNSQKISSSLVSTADVHAKITGTGNIDMTLHINPTAELPTFDVALQVKKIDLASLNQLLEWQTALNFKHGTFALDAEAHAADGGFKGYIKPFIENLKVENSEDKSGIVQKAKKIVINAASVIFKNKETDKVATRVPFEGKFENPKTDIWEAVVALLRNAFIQAIKPGLDPSL